MSGGCRSVHPMIDRPPRGTQMTKHKTSPVINFVPVGTTSVWEPSRRSYLEVPVYAVAGSQAAGLTKAECRRSALAEGAIANFLSASDPSRITDGR